MKHGIEAHNLRQVWQSLGGKTDRHQVMGLVQWGKGYESLEFGKHLRGDQCRVREFQPAMHNSMPEGNKPIVMALAAQEFNQVLNCPVVSELSFLRPCVPANLSAQGILGGEAWRRIKSIKLAAEFEVAVVSAFGKNRELDARRAGIEN
jgi:hypothetical protein